MQSLSLLSDSGRSLVIAFSRPAQGNIGRPLRLKRSATVSCRSRSPIGAG